MKFKVDCDYVEGNAGFTITIALDKPSKKISVALPVIGAAPASIVDVVIQTVNQLLDDEFIDNKEIRGIRND